MVKTIQYISNEPDSATAVAHEFDTTNAFSTDGAKILSIKNAGVEKLTVSKDGVMQQTKSVVVVRPDEGGDAIAQAMSDMRVNGGGIVQLLPGTYNVTQPFHVAQINLGFGMKNVTLQGVGDATILSYTGTSGSIILLNGQASGQPAQSITDTTAGDTSVFLTTPAQASFFSVGTIVFITGTDPNEPAAPNFSVQEQWNVVKTAGNVSSGEIELEFPIAFDISSATVTRTSGALNNKVKDLKIIDGGATGGGDTILALQITQNIGSLIENVTVECSANIGAGIAMNSNLSSTIRNCKVFNSRGDSINSTGSHSTVEDCFIYNAAIGTIADRAGITAVAAGTNQSIVNNVIEKSGRDGIMVREASNGHGRRMVINGNIIKDCTRNSMRLYKLVDSVISNNIIDGFASSDFAGLRVNVIKRSSIMGNIIRNGDYGIYASGALGCTIVGNIIENMTDIAINVTFGFSQGENNVIQGNVMRNIGGVNTGAIYVGGSNYNSITGNVIDSVTHAVGSGIRLYNVDHSTIAGNVIQNIVRANSGIRLDGSGLAPTNDCIIMGNNMNGEGLEKGPTGFGTGNIDGLNKE